MIRRLAFISVLFSAMVVIASAQPGSPSNEIARGQIIEKLTCADKPDQSYALYLPANYDPARKWPVLYAFDPGARGKLPVERYQEAAERFGWIVVGSNNSRNASWQSSIDSWNAITHDTHQRFSIDDARLYVAGLSGGARTAVGIAVACENCVTGVIASAAGFPPSVTPSASIHFAIFTTSGINDFNFPEVKTLEAQLTKLGIPNQMAVFDGGHEWLPVSVAVEAVGWMELFAMQSGKLQPDTDKINAIWKARYDAAQALESSGKLYDAYLIYAAMGKTFKGLREINDVQAKANLLESKAEVREAIKDEQQQFKKQRDFDNQIGGLIYADGRARSKEISQAATDNTANELLDPRARLHQLFLDLRKQAKAETDSGNRRVARRVLDGQYIGLIERATPLLREGKQLDEAARLFTLASEVNPDRSGTFYYLAWAYAAKGEKKKALQSIKTAIEKGFTDIAAIDSNQAFDSVRNDKQYEEIIGRIKKP